LKFIFFSVAGVIDCGIISGIAVPASVNCATQQTGIVCEIPLVSITKYLIDFIIKTKVL
jgi:hypothetical protein